VKAVSAPARHGLLALLVYLAFWLLLSGEVWTGGPTFLILGDPQGDIWKHLWGHKWVCTNVLLEHHFPTSTRALGYPDGGTLLVIDILNALAACLLYPLAGPVLGYNLLVTALVIFAAWAGRKLVYELCADPWAALLGGLLFGFAPMILGYGIGSGVAETLQHGWIALYCLNLLRLLRAPRLREALFCPLLLLLASLGSFYYGIFCLLLTGALVLVRLAAREYFPVPLSFAPPQGWAWMGYLALSLALGAALLLPLERAWTDASQGSTSLHPAYVSNRAPGNLARYIPPSQGNSATLLGILSPGKGNARVTRVVDELVRIDYLGLAALGLALFSLTASLRRRSGVWWIMGAAFLVLSLGPYLAWSAQIQAGRPVSLAYMGLYGLLPLFRPVAIPYRLLIMVTLCLAVLAGIGTTRLLGGCSQTARRWVAAGLVILVCADIALFSPAPFPLPASPVAVSTFYHDLAATHAPAGAPDMGILDLPFHRSGSLLYVGQYFLYQQEHGQGIPYTVSGIDLAWVGANPLLRALFLLEKDLAIPSDPIALAAGAAALSSQGYRIIIMHPNLYDNRTGERARRLLEETLGPARSNQDLLLFHLDPPPGRRE